MPLRTSSRCSNRAARWWWSSAIREVEHDTRGLPVEVWTLAGSLYRLEFLDRTTLTLPGIVERAALAQGRE